MDTAVALVQAYLRLNGYFTVAEFPVVAHTASPDGRTGLRTLTDLDILAFRFPVARRPAPRAAVGGSTEHATGAVDRALGAAWERADMIIGEVKEGYAELNAGASNPAVLKAALARFGCCSSEEAAHAAHALLRDGRVELPHGHSARLVAFGSIAPPGRTGPDASVHCVSLQHVFDYVRQQVRDQWRQMKAGGTKDAALGWFLLEEKARRATQADHTR